jgi:hypothetical protein
MSDGEVKVLITICQCIQTVLLAGIAGWVTVSRTKKKRD